jgi:L-alanine-DL-glutamate epimerase-like enolase superfamily enzyme
MKRNSWGIAGGQVEIFRVALKAPFITALGRKSETVNVGIHLRLHNGASGYGEASGSVVNARLRPQALARVLRGELKRAAGQDARRLKFLVSGVRQRNRECPPAAAAFECALTEALARGFGLRLCDWFGGAQETLETDITLSAGTPEAACKAARRAAREGFRIFKVKVGTGPEQDFMRALTVWETVRENIRRPSLLLDGNQGLTPKQALGLVEKCLRRKVHVVLFEQPVARENLKGLAWLRRRSPVPIAADESVRSAGDAHRLLDLDAVDVFNLKVAKTGLQESLEIIALAKSAGKKLMIGCMQESARGLSASVHLACGTGVFKFVDLDSDHLLVAKQPAGNFRRDGPKIKLIGD